MDFLLLLLLPCTKILILLFIIVLSSSSRLSHSLTCTSQKLTNNNKSYNNCTDLPSLKAYLHWTYHSSNASLAIAFLAPPAKSNGWIAWAINPTGTGMAGAQTLIAFKQPNGSMMVNTYNISSYSSIVPSKLSFHVSHSSAEYSGGLMKIFATLALPNNMTLLNQVWQVGGDVTDAGRPVKHDFNRQNLNALGVLDLVGSQNATNPPGGSTSNDGSSGNNNTTSGNENSITGSSGNNKSGGFSIRREGRVGSVYVISLFFLGMLGI